MIQLSDIERARNRVAPYIHRTPLVRSTTLSDRYGTNVHLKLELFQRTGSFKPRGAFNQVLGLSDGERRAGIVGVSGGNFAQGIAYAGRTLGVDTVVVMPRSAPQSSIDATTGYGATVDFAPNATEAFAKVDEHVERGRTAVHPFDNPAMMAGNGTLGLELVEDLPDLTDVFISVGGGGFFTGVITAVHGLTPGVRFFTVETEGADVLARSLAARRRVELAPTSLAVTLGSPYLAEDAYDMARKAIEDAIVVSDEAAYRAQRFLLERTKVVPELAAACTLAALGERSERFEPTDNVVLILCGGNVSLADLASYRSRFDGD